MEERWGAGGRSWQSTPSQERGESCTEQKPGATVCLQPQTVLAMKAGGLVWLQAYWTFCKWEERGIQTILKLPQTASMPPEVKENEPKLLEPPLAP